MQTSPITVETGLRKGARIAIIGRLSGMSRREACDLIRQSGAVPLEQCDRMASTIVVGDETAGRGTVASAVREAAQDEATRRAIQNGQIEVIGETELWRRLGLVDLVPEIQTLYTPAMMASLLEVDISAIRRWHRRGLIRPTRTVRRLAYFDFRQVVIARRLAALLREGISQQALERRLSEWSQQNSGVDGPLGQLAVAAGGRLLLRQEGQSLSSADGQKWFSFVCQTEPKPYTTGHAAPGGPPTEILPLTATAAQSAARSVEDLVQLAEELEDGGELEAAADIYRSALAMARPNPDLCFALAEVLYRLGDIGGARERYSMAIELDEGFVEARANLGCLFSEEGRIDLAIAAFEGALQSHGDYADAHYHLARTLRQLGRTSEARPHWEAFLELAPNSPWAAEVRLLLALAEPTDSQPAHEGSAEAAPAS
jgi:tetratricopeptide (TPR) repeat protein